jgi:hypothetical protein
LNYEGLQLGARGSLVVEMLCCKPEGGGFQNRQKIVFYQFTKFFRLHWTLGFIRLVPSMSTRRNRKK